VKLSENFNLEEWRVSREYPALAREIVISPTEAARIALFTRLVLQPLRNHLRIPVTILSGKRSFELNLRVKGHARSDHHFDDHPDVAAKQGGAVDITCSNLGAMRAWLLEHTFLLKQLGIYNDRGFFHLGFPDLTGRYGEVFYA
jgi:hypothetical protein